MLLSQLESLSLEQVATASHSTVQESTAAGRAPAFKTDMAANIDDSTQGCHRSMAPATREGWKTHDHQVISLEGGLGQKVLWIGVLTL